MAFVVSYYVISEASKNIFIADIKNIVAAPVHTGKR